jgi:hypothetical protein
MEPLLLTDFVNGQLMGSTINGSEALQEINNCGKPKRTADEGIWETESYWGSTPIVWEEAIRYFASFSFYIFLIDFTN